MGLEREDQKPRPCYRLGFAVRILGEPRLRSHDARRWASRPHLSVSLLYLRDILLYLQRHNIGMYRLADGLAPYLAHPERPEFHQQVAECAAELAEVGRIARQAGVRLTMHLPPQLGLSTPDEELAAQVSREIEARALLLRTLGSADPVLVVHAGGRYAGGRGVLERIARRVLQLSQEARAVLAIEHDRRFSLNDVLHLHALSGIPVIFDYLHHQLYNPQQLEEHEALQYALMTWPAAQRPKAHFSSPRTELRIIERPARGRRPARAIEPPDMNEHSDYVHPFECIRFLRLAAALRPFDLMLEAKAGDLALLRLRADLQRFAPNLAGLIT